MRTNTIIVLDFETGGKSPSTCEITQVAAIAIDPRTLLPFENGEFNSEMRPLQPELLEDEALMVTRKTREKLAEAPTPSEVWSRFTAWCRLWNLGGNNDRYSLPLPAGHNFFKFDSKILQRYCEKYGPHRVEENGEKVQSLFSDLYYYDTLQMMNHWTEGLTDPSKLSLDYLRRFFDMSKESSENAHDALQDVRDTAVILKKLLDLHRKHARNVVFKDCCNPEKLAAELERRARLKAKRKSR